MLILIWNSIPKVVVQSECKFVINHGWHKYASAKLMTTVPSTYICPEILKPSERSFNFRHFLARVNLRLSSRLKQMKQMVIGIKTDAYLYRT